MHIESYSCMSATNGEIVFRNVKVKAELGISSNDELDKLANRVNNKVIEIHNYPPNLMPTDADFSWCRS